MAKLLVLVGRWGLPPDDVAWAALAFGLACVFATLASRDLFEALHRASRTRFLATAGIVAAFLTLGYAAHYLRGGPRIIDATAYVLQAKALAHGHVTWPTPFPSASFRGRFLLAHDGHLSGIFPPGWPLLLSVGFILGSPMLVGIALSAALVVATYVLALELASDHVERETIARFAALLSVACAALRYHTADPMAHAATALAVTLAFVFALRASRSSHAVRAGALAGACIGWTACTRPISALAIFAVALFLVRRSNPRALAAFFVAILPGVALLLAVGHASTGSFFTSTQRTYYAVSDGPPGCFRYGFGEGIGCLHEHGDFVRARLGSGFDLAAAIGTTLRRLHHHLSDALAAWPLALLVIPACFSAARRSPALRSAWTLVLLHVAAYAPFYFDGDYPGGGARFYADILPIEHAAIAVSLAALFLAIDLRKKTAFVVGLVAIAFATHASFDHLALADRDGGRPMFEPEHLQDTRIESGLLFVDTDHGFDLAYDPSVTDPKHGLVVARLRNDAHDRLIFEELGRPPTWAYRFGQPTGHAEPTLLPFTPPAADVAGRELWRFESEVDWPPLAQDGAWAEPTFATGARQNCPSAGQVLLIHPSPSGVVRIAVPIPRDGAWTVRPVLLSRPGDGDVDLRLADLHWSSAPPHDTAPVCTELSSQTTTLSKGEVPLEIRVSAGPVALDRIEVLAAHGDH